MTVVSILGLIALIPVVVVDSVFLAETFCGLIRPIRPAVLENPIPSICILMPAHNEATTLAAAGEMFQRLIAGGTRIVVVADNCTDTTAAVARASGCDVVERNDLDHRGKGYALAAGRDHLTRDPPDIVIVLDADSWISEDSLAILATRSITCACAVQAAYLFRHDPQAPAKIQISNFAFAVKNLVRQRGGKRLGSAAILSGSGMAFPWGLISTLDLATGNVVEDLVLGVDLVRRQQPPVFEEAATVWSDASNCSGTETQRSRWEGGFITTARQFAWPLIVEGITRRDFKRFWLGAHLIVPALSIVLSLNVIVFLLLAALAMVTSAQLPAIGAAILLMLIVIAVASAWIVEGRRHMAARIFLQIPGYLTWKIAMYARLLTGRQSIAWIRTERVRKD